MTSVWAVVMDYHVFIPCQGVKEARVRHSGHFLKPSFDSVHALNGSGKHHLSGSLLLVSQSWRTVYALLYQQSLICAHHIF